jgi:hypothetical protein
MSRTLRYTPAPSSSGRKCALRERDRSPAPAQRSPKKAGAGGKGTWGKLGSEEEQ